MDSACRRYAWSVEEAPRLDLPARPKGKPVCQLKGLSLFATICEISLARNRASRPAGSIVCIS